MKTSALSLLFALAIAVPVAAQPLGPEELVRKVTTDVLDTIKNDRDLIAGDRKKTLALAEQKVLPHVDFREAAQLAVGKSWHAATPAQQERLVTEFRSMLVRVYSSAIDVYRGQTMRVLPVKMPPNATDVVVRNQYLRSGRPPVPVEYAMRKTSEGWKIYDIVVEGVSLVLTYRAEFDNIARNAGIEGLIRRLQEKNA